MSGSRALSGRTPAAERPPRVGPLFITHFSDSPRTAIGVQTTALMSALPGSRNAYFATAELYRNSDRRIRFENAIICRAGRLQVPRRSDLLGRAGVGWWDGGRLRASKLPRVRAIAARTNIVYLSPLNESDAARMRTLVQLIDRPFVLHLWDSLSGPVGSNTDLLWLIQHARRVLAVSESLRDDAERAGGTASILRFSRRPASVRAAAPDAQEPLRVALIGLLDPYVDGVVLLDRAVTLAAARGARIELVFVGPPKLIRNVAQALSNPLPSTGFLSDAARDEVLASCHAGFLPGPFADPAADMRSRYSIPSRSLDFLAVGLPAVGTLHPDSAAGRFSREAGLGEHIACRTPERLAAALVELRDVDRWQQIAEREQDAFRRLTVMSPAVRLAQMFEEVLRETPSV